MRLLLIRHCQSSGQAPDAPLTERGVEQAHELAEWLGGRGIDRIVSSPYRRARQTIEPFVARAGLELELDARLAERTLSAEPIEHWRDLVRDSFHDPELRAPGGESAGETLVRGHAALRASLEAQSQLPLLVTHGNLMSLLLHSLDGRFGYAGWQGLSNPDVYLVEGAELERLRFERLWA